MLQCFFHDVDYFVWSSHEITRARADSVWLWEHWLMPLETIWRLAAGATFANRSFAALPVSTSQQLEPSVFVVMEWEADIYKCLAAAHLACPSSVHVALGRQAANVCL